MLNSELKYYFDFKHDYTIQEPDSLNSLQIEIIDGSLKSVTEVAGVCAGFADVHVVK